MDHACPECAKPVPSRDVAGQSRRLPYRTCPSCQARITQDRDTKRRQLVALAIALGALAATAAATYWAGLWWVVTASVGIALVAWIAYGERRVRWVPYADG